MKIETVHVLNFGTGKVICFEMSYEFRPGP